MTLSIKVYFIMIILIPLLGFLINALFFKNRLIPGSQLATLSIWIGFAGAMIAWVTGLPFSEKTNHTLFVVNEISWFMATLILFVSGIVHHFSLRYLLGDRNYRRYFLSLTSITISTLLMLASDHIVMLITFWSVSNLILVFLMIHKFQWTAAKNSGLLALKTFTLGFLFLSIGSGLLAYESGSFSLYWIVKQSANFSNSTRGTALFFIMLAAFTQSGAWPFHRWLISSLNSPTPVSSLMHAGLVNGGGLLLARFGFIFLHERILLNSLFVFGLITLILGGIWKLMQSDIKRMLACSTMTQMGFMMMQCGLGLFPAALAHLCWHGLFKSFLFLRAGSSIGEQRRTNEERTSTIPQFLIASFCGAFGAFGFMAGGSFPLLFQDTTTVLVLFAWMGSTQIAHTLIETKHSLFFVLIASVLCLMTGVLYGTTIHMIERIVAPIGISQPQTLTPIHIGGIALIICIWLGMNLKLCMKYEGSIWWRRFYVSMLNASQPDPNTTTSSRNGYKF